MERSDSLSSSGKDLWRKAHVKLIAVGRLSSSGKRVGSHKSASKVSTLLQSSCQGQAQGVTVPVPYASAIPIYVDSSIDVLLIGIIVAASFHAGAIMALATTIE